MSNPPKVSLEETNRADEPTLEDAPARRSDRPLDFLDAPQAQSEIGRLGHFRILKELGRGGMGCVLLAEDTKLDRLVALKVMLPKYAAQPTAHARFLREAKAAAKLHHDHVITIFAVGEAKGIPYIAMELLKGMGLDKYLENKGELPLATALRIGREIALGLQAAQAIGLVHRDIKPPNVWLEAPKGRVKILDFGLARQEEEGAAQLTQSGAIIGTPAYMAPEQIDGEKLDGRADLFSLGVLLYRLLAGTPAFTGATTAAMLVQVTSREPPTVSEIKPEVPDEAEVAILGGPGYHLPTDLEWEHACRGGTRTEYYFGNKADDLPQHAWFVLNSNQRPHPVGELQPNAFGLFDMRGNVREWNEDLVNTTQRAARGGAWTNDASDCTLSVRGTNSRPAARNNNRGFRVARRPALPEE